MAYQDVTELRRNLLHHLQGSRAHGLHEAPSTVSLTSHSLALSFKLVPAPVAAGQVHRLAERGTSHSTAVLVAEGCAPCDVGLVSLVCFVRLGPGSVLGQTLWHEIWRRCCNHERAYKCMRCLPNTSCAALLRDSTQGMKARPFGPQVKVWRLHARLLPSFREKPGDRYASARFGFLVVSAEQRSLISCCCCCHTLHSLPAHRKLVTGAFVLKYGQTSTFGWLPHHAVPSRPVRRTEFDNYGCCARDPVGCGGRHGPLVVEIRGIRDAVRSRVPRPLPLRAAHRPTAASASAQHTL